MSGEFCAILHHIFGEFSALTCWLCMFPLFCIVGEATSKQPESVNVSKCHWKNKQTNKRNVCYYETMTIERNEKSVYMCRFSWGHYTESQTCIWHSFYAGRLSGWCLDERLNVDNCTTRMIHFSAFPVWNLENNFVNNVNCLSYKTIKNI